jgi:hypothetical protein
LFALNIIVKPVYHALKDGVEFFGLFKKEKITKNLAYIICNYDGMIKDISACNEFIFIYLLSIYLYIF